MVRIEKLEMQGFKSFAKKTVVTFPSNFSVVCGPNGSGKSNILDAIVFVLGRTSAKAIRADKMLETIFHGSKNKDPAEFAKITLYIDNSDKKIPLEEDKIIISRTVNSKSISIYKLNGKTVNRETILEILRHAHINPEGHNIILQGQITEVVEMSSLERREIIDEISGIMEYDEKKDKAQRELLTVEERLKESSIILTERETSLKRLEQEWKAAQQYRKLTTELDKLRASLAKQKLEEAESSMEKLSKKSEEKTKDIREFEKEVERINREIETKEKERQNLSKKLFDRAKDIEIVKEIEKIKSEISRKRDRIEFNKSEIIRLEDLIKRLEFLKQKEMEGTASKAVQEILKLGRTGIYGTVASLMRTDVEHQVAIEVAAGNHLHDIIVQNENVAIEAINYLKKNRIGRATFLPLDKIRPREFTEKGLLEEEGVVDIALNLIDFDRKYANAFSFIFGDTLVVNRIETAKRIGIGKTRYVTLDGDLVEKSGMIIGGFYQKRIATEFEDIEKYSKQKSVHMKDIGDLEREIESLKKRLEGLSGEEQLGSKELVKMQKDLETIEKNIEELRNRSKETFNQKLAFEDEINRVNINKARWEASLENLRAEFENYKDKETYKLAVSTLENKIRENISYLNSLGLVNMKALEEYDIQKVQYDELKSKVDKLASERDKVLSIIAEVEGKRKETFEKTLNQLREQFKVVFKDLTGGESDLRLEGEILEDSGLIIEASPAGKRLLNIDAMSGGEKTLTALAFLFAIQKFRPAPFYVLDEVDAALDKPNIKKITELIKNYSRNAQFIVISHNDTTIAAADCVYGVSMEGGESKLVGIKMPE